MDIVISPTGVGHCIYSEDFPLSELGQLKISRASHVEPGEDGKWWADMSPVDGPKLGPFDERTEALACEVTWLEENWLTAERSALVVDSPESVAEQPTQVSLGAMVAPTSWLEEYWLKSDQSSELDAYFKALKTNFIQYVDSQWWADMSTVNGPKYGPFKLQAEASKAADHFRHCAHYCWVTNEHSEQMIKLFWTIPDLYPIGWFVKGRDSEWWVDLRPVGGFEVGPFASRREAFAAEQRCRAPHLRYIIVWGGDSWGDLKAVNSPRPKLLTEQTQAIAAEIRWLLAYRKDA